MDKQPLPMYDQAVSLRNKIKNVKVAMRISSSIVHYSADVVKVRVDFLSMGVSTLHIEYWGNADFSWVKENIAVNAKSIREA